MKEKIILSSGNRKVSLEAKVARGLGRFSGLMFSRRERAGILLFKFKKPVKMAIHSLFVFFPFIAIWRDSDGKIMEIRRVMPFSWYVCPQKSFKSFVEIPLNRKYKRITDGIEKFK
jgi:uncharacterized membrane protein (UPF0127 family)